MHDVEKLNDNGRNNEKGDSEDILVEEPTAKYPPKVKLLYIDSRVIEKMLRIFLEGKIKQREAVVLSTGRAEKEIAYITTIWPTRILRVSEAYIEPDHFWLYKCIKAAIQIGHNVVVEAHRHPIGASYSSIDEKSLKIMSEWLKPAGITYIIVCCEIEFAAYFLDDSGNIIRMPIAIWTPVRAVKGSADDRLLIEGSGSLDRRCLLIHKLRSFFRKFKR